MKKFITIFSLLIVLACQVSIAATPQQALQACVTKLKGAKSAKAEFSINSQGHTSSGTLLCKGNTFAVTSGANGTWYDGSDIWVYSPATGEVTVWKPVQSELAEANPLLYLSTAGDYNVAAGTGGAKGETILTLTPKRRSSGVKSIRVVLNSATSLPKSMDITTGSGKVKVTLKSLQLGAALNDSDFKFPKSRYPKARVSDLR